MVLLSSSDGRRHPTPFNFKGKDLKNLKNLDISRASANTPPSRTPIASFDEAATIKMLGPDQFTLGHVANWPAKGWCGLQMDR